MDSEEGMPDRPLGIMTASFSAGIAGAGVVTIIGTLAHLLGVTTFSSEIFLGSLMTRQTSIGTALLGFLLQLLVGGLIGLLYGIAFRRLARSGTRLGVLFGIMQWIILGFVLSWITKIHPLVPLKLLAPGAYAANLGVGAILTFLIQQVVFGAFVGRAYWRALWNYEAHKSLLDVRDRAA